MQFPDLAMLLGSLYHQLVLLVINIIIVSSLVSLVIIIITNVAHFEIRKQIAILFSALTLLPTQWTADHRNV